jgi:hypothetical protein
VRERGEREEDTEKKRRKERQRAKYIAGKTEGKR